MPDKKMNFMPNSKLMTADEIYAIAKTFTDLGITKIRLTGGEPLVRSDFDSIAKQLATLPVSLHITTNGFLLDSHLDILKECDFKTINISLDTLKEDKFSSITQYDGYTKVLENIKKALELGFNVKINNVLMKKENDDEIIDFINLTKEYNLSVRFIEFMPFSKNEWSFDKAVSHKDILSKVQSHYQQEIESLDSLPNGTTKNYRIKDFNGDFGVISTVSEPFCSTCNRIRLTADGKLKNCLFSSGETDILTAYRNNINIQNLIFNNIKTKAFSRGGMATNDEFNTKGANHKNRSMIAIGG